LQYLCKNTNNFYTNQQKPRLFNRNSPNRGRYVCFIPHTTFERAIKAGTQTCGPQICVPSQKVWIRAH